MRWSPSPSSSSYSCYCSRCNAVQWNDQAENKDLQYSQTQCCNALCVKLWTCAIVKQRWAKCVVGVAIKVAGGRFSFLSNNPRRFDSFSLMSYSSSMSSLSPISPSSPISSPSSSSPSLALTLSWRVHLEPGVSPLQCGLQERGRGKTAHYPNPPLPLSTPPRLHYTALYLGVSESLSLHYHPTLFQLH